MAQALIDDNVEYLGVTYPLRLRRVGRRSCYTWQLGHEDGSPMKSGKTTVPNVEMAQRLAREYLERTWPFGRSDPFGTGNGSP